MFSAFSRVRLLLISFLAPFLKPLEGPLHFHSNQGNSHACALPGCPGLPKPAFPNTLLSWISLSLLYQN